MIDWNWQIDGWIVAAGVLASAAAALVGNFVVLRRMSLLGDAISHAVLPGLAVAYLATGTRSSGWMFVGAVAVGLLTAALTHWVHRAGEVDEGASMGVVFTSLFALGLLLIVNAADHVDLDPGCVLYGAIELTPLDTWRMLGGDVPRVVVVLSAVLAVNALYVTLLFKELRLAAFDPAFATTTGFRAAAMHYSLMTLVAVTAVASFEAVGNILVVAMLVAPPATARLLTDRLGVMVVLSVILAAAAAVGGHLAAITVPTWFGFRSTTTAGSMAVASGLLFAAAVLFAPRHGVVARVVRRRLVGLRVLGEDVLGLLYRAHESHTAAVKRDRLIETLGCRDATLSWVLRGLVRRGLVEHAEPGVRLTLAGESHARKLVRSHRLWENYLVERVGVASERTHPHAELLEHVTDPALRASLDGETDATATDPHGRAIPDETETLPRPNKGDTRS